MRDENENLYINEVDRDAVLMPVEEFVEQVALGVYCDDDGFGCPVKDGMEKPTQFVYPSRISYIPEDATHIAWYNK